MEKASWRLQYLNRAYKKATERLFPRECSDRARGNDLKLKEGRFKLDNKQKLNVFKKNSLLRRVMRH